MWASWPPRLHSATATSEGSVTFPGGLQLRHRCFIASCAKQMAGAFLPSPMCTEVANECCDALRIQVRGVKWETMCSFQALHVQEQHGTFAGSQACRTQCTRHTKLVLPVWWHWSRTKDGKSILSAHYLTNPAPNAIA